MAANATTASDTHPAPAASAALIEQAKQDGLTIEQERYIRSLPKDPKHYWEGYSDKPVPAKLGPNTFMFPMNLYDNQIGPDFQGSVALTLHWPDLKAFPPGARNDPKYAEAYTSESITIRVYYVDRRPIESLMSEWIKPFSPSRDKDPRENLSLRISGKPIFGLMPYYADLEKITVYFKERNIHSDQEGIINASKDWYLAYTNDGDLESVITCSSRAIPGAKLVNGRIENTRPGVQRGSCTQEWTINKYKIRISVYYLRAYLQDWNSIQKKVAEIFEDNLQH